MKNLFTFIMLAFSAYANAQAGVGIGTAVPNSTLDVRGALSLNIRVFTGTTTPVSATDNAVIFTGTAASTATLPDATTCAGRLYSIKNASITSPTPLLTIATTASQTIDGISTWILDEGYGAITIVSNGANWLISSQSVPKSSGSAWVQGGNNVSAVKNIGTTSNYALPFITSNTEKMRLTSTGSLGIGTSTFNGTNTEKLLVDAGASGNTNYQNVIVGKGNTNSYAQLNIQNTYSAAANAASSDVVATSDNGTESVNFIDMGINSGTNTTTGILGAANTAYLYSTGNDFIIGNSTGSKNLRFFTGGTNTSNEGMRIDGSGNVGIGVTDPANPLVVKDTLEIRRTGSVSELLFSNTAGTGDFRIGSDGSDIFWQGGGGRNLQMGAYWGISLVGDRHLSTFPSYEPGVLNTGVLIQAQRDASVPLAIQANSATQSANLTEWRNSSGAVLNVVDENGNVGIGTSAFNGTYPEQLIVNAGTPGTITDYQNVIVGKGNTNSYAQLNIQNTYSAAANSASSDVVATSDNGSESVNFIDMGINSGTNTTAGVIGGANTAYLYSTGNNFAIGSGTNSKDLVFFTTTAGTYTDRMHITSAGHLIPSANNTYDLGSSANRWRTIYSNNVLNTSDARLKKNIGDLNYGLPAILKMRPVQYNWKEGEDKEKKIGFLAQELRKIIPEVVVGDESKETLAVNYIELIPVLVKAIKEQQKQIDDLRKKIAVLKRK